VSPAKFIVHSFINGSRGFLGSWQVSFCFIILCAAGRTPWTGISTSQGICLQTGQHKHRINAHRYPCFERDSNPRTQQPKAFYVLDSTATVIGCRVNCFSNSRLPDKCFKNFLKKTWILSFSGGKAQDCVSDDTVSGASVIDE
jgi:hypothetical protein